MITIPLTQGFVTVVDDCDAALARFNWTAYKRPRTIYAARRFGPAGNQTEVFLHREILGVTERTDEVDHEDGDGLNNRRYNLRQATHQQNGQHRVHKQDSASRFLGVHWCKTTQRWRAQIKAPNGRRISLGRYDQEVAAAFAYDAAAIRLFGEFAAPNFPGMVY